MTRKTMFWFLATGVAVALTAAVPQAGQQAPKPTQPAPRGGGQPTRGDAEGPGHGRRQRHVRHRPGDDRHGVQLRRAGLPGVRDPALPRRHPQGERLHRRERRRRHSLGVGGQVGLGPPGDRARLGRGLHPAGVAEARRRLSRSDRRRRARPRRGSQLRHPAQHRRGDRRQAHHGAREAPRHDHDLARHRRRAARHQGLLRARGAVQGRRPGDVQPRRLQPRRPAGARAAATG